MEDTQKKIESDNENLIQEMLRNVQPTEIESELTRNPIIHKGDKDLEAPMTVNKISSAGYVWVWETDTHEKVPILYYMLAKKLRSKRPDGSYRFTTIDPGVLPKRGEIKCLLHEEHPNREHFKELGFRTCRKSTLTSLYQMQQHMMKRHPQEWKAIEQERIEKERAEDRALSRLLLQSQLKQNPAPEPATEKEAEAEGMYQCSKCNKPHMFTSKLGQEHIEYKLPTKTI